MIKSFKYRLYPNEEQKLAFSKHFGCTRWVYNNALETKIKAFQVDRKNLSVFELTKALVPLKEEYPWLKEVNSQSLQSALQNLDKAFTAFFRKQNKFPKFKNKRDHKSFHCPQGVKVSFETKSISFPKIRNVRAVLHRPFNGNIKTVTVTQTFTDKYFAIVLVDDCLGLPVTESFTPDNSIGVDLGVKHFAVLSTGEKIDNPRLLKKAAKKLARAQRNLCRKKNGSKNRIKSKKKVALAHEKIVNKRKDFQHKLSSRLIDENQAICLEDLAVANLLGNKRLSKHISDTAWGQFREFCEYKAAHRGKSILIIGRFEPSSKMCSACGAINHNLKLSNREWTCTCGVTHDRDVLAANNILNFALHSAGVAQFQACGERLK